MTAPVGQVAICTVDDVIARINARFTTEKPSGGFADASVLAATKAVVDAATALNTASALVRRDANGSAAVAELLLGNDPAGTTAAARKGYVDAQVGTRILSTLLGANNGVATLDSTGKLPSSQLPPLAINEVFVAASQAAMVALTAQRGDMVRRTDFTPNRMYVLSTDSSATAADWIEINAAGTVTSVDGQTGAVSLGSAGLGASTLARRTSTGQLIAADATAATELTTFSQMNSAISNTGVATMGRDRGSGTTLPSTDLRRGDVYYHTGWACLFMYNGSAWRQDGDLPVVATNAARAALPTNVLYTGFKCWNTACGCEQLWDGSGWRFTLSGFVIGSPDANGILAMNHGGGQTPLAYPTVGLLYSQNDAQNVVNKVMYWFSDATVIQARFVRTDQSTYWTNPGLGYSWFARF